MTTNNPTRRGRRTLGYAPKANGASSDDVRVGDRLRDLREARGLDLYRVERDTKIRHKFLVALEAGDYADLPGDVYARGFLRNYATYLGLDPDEIIDEWRTESGPKAAPANGQAAILGAPRPLAMPRRGFFLQTSHMVLVAVILIVAIVGVYFGYQVMRFNSSPTLSVGCPGSSASASTSGGTAASGSAPVLTVSASGTGSCFVSQGVINITAAMGATTYFLSGTATAGSTVTIVWNLQDLKPVQVDDGGHWSYQAVLTPGRNKFDITAQGIDANHVSKTSTIVITVPVPTPTPAVPVVAFSGPTDGQSFPDGKIAISGTSSFVTQVKLVTTYLGVPPAPGQTLAPGSYSTPAPSGSGLPTAAPTPAPTPTPTTSTKPTPASSIPAAPVPLTAPVGPDGAFSFVAVTLDPGVWRLTITGQDANGRTSASVSRVVSVPFTGVVVVIRVQGAGGSWMLYRRDGVSIGQSTYLDGYTVTLSAKHTVCVVAGKPGNVYLNVNGVDIGTVGGFGGTRVLVDGVTGPKKVASC